MLIILGAKVAQSAGTGIILAVVLILEATPQSAKLSGGTNSKTAELAKMCGINYNGIA